MTPQELDQAYQNLASVIQGEATRTANQIGTNQAAKAPGLAYNTGGVGQYNYQRLYSPVVDPITTQLVAAGKQAAFKQALQDEYTKAASRYQNAYSSYASRQRSAASGGGSSTAAGAGGGGVDIIAKDNINGAQEGDVVVNEFGNVIRRFQGGKWVETKQADRVPTIKQQEEHLSSGAFLDTPQTADTLGRGYGGAGGAF